MKIGRREQKLLIQALYGAIQWERSYIEAWTPVHSFEKPSAEGRRAIRESTKKIERYKKLREKIQLTSEMG
jgi:hypothetical protein